MVRQCATIVHQFIASRAADETIQQAVPVNVAGLFPLKKETDTAETMDAGPHAGPSADLRFDFADRPKTRRMKQAGRAEQHGVKNLRGARDAGEPFQPANGELKDQVPFSFTGSRSATDGPFKTFPNASNRDPWQGQSQVVSVRFQ